MSAIVEICVCGHSVDRHELAHTEYARCENQGCWCEGGVRVAAIVAETRARPNATQTNSRYFRRQFRVSSPLRHPLTDGVRKTRDMGIPVSWVIESCDRCGNVWDGELSAYMANENGEAQVVVREVCGRTVLLCGICDTEVKALERMRGEMAYG